jgi:hypothetical protein
VGPVDPGTPPIEDEDDDENDKVLRTLSEGRSRRFELAFPPKIFVWQRCAVTVFLRDHRENELNPNPWFKA